MQCGDALPDDAHLCGNCGTATSPATGGGGSGGQTAAPVVDSYGAAMDGLRQTLDQVSRYRKLASSGPVDLQVIKDGVALHDRAMRELDAVVAMDPARARFGERALRDGLTLPVFVDSSLFVSAMQRLTAPSPASKRLLQEILPIYAQRGVADVVKAAGRSLSSQFSEDFAEELGFCHAVRKYLDQATCPIIFETLYRNKLFPIQKHLWTAVTVRVGIDVMQRAMANVDRLRR